LSFLNLGDYAEIPESCPATTTCPLICVADESDCPTTCTDGLKLCLDGTCMSICDESIESPCECDEAMVACAKVIDLYDSCKSKYEVQYDEYATCLEEQEEAVETLSFTSPWFLLVYFWMVCTSLLVVVWCAYNQKIAPCTEKSIQCLTPISASSNGSPTKEFDQNDWLITGYKKHIIGTFLCIIVWITLWGIQFLLFLLTIFYYMQQEAITRWTPVFYDEGQVLMAFE
jgi:hypothetical protein